MSVTVPTVPPLLPRLSVWGDGISTATVLWALLAIVVWASISKFYKGLKAVNYLPGLRSPFNPYSIPSYFFGPTWFNPGYTFLWDNRDKIYRHFNAETFSYVPWLVGSPIVYTSNLEVLRQVTSGSLKTDFEKPKSLSATLLFWGRNMVAADGEAWKRHRRVVSPAFNDKLYQNVWSKSTDIYGEMIEGEGWGSKETVDIPAIQKHISLFVLLVISNCVFGIPFRWIEPTVTEGGAMTVQTALRIINEKNMVVSSTPEWMLGLPLEGFEGLAEAVSTLRKFMRENVTEKKASVLTDKVIEDVFSLMVKSSVQGDYKSALGDDELIGNVLVMLFAGHETTANALAACLAFLACEPKVEQEVFDEIISVVGWDRKPVFDHYERLDKVQSLFLESLRMYPSGYLLFREATTDTVLQLQRPVGQDGVDTLPVQRGTTVCIDMVGLQRNPRYLEDPHVFKPSRWYGSAKEGDAFTAFSLGPRQCIGRKFALVEAVSFLTSFIRDWRVEPLLRDGESLNRWKERVFDAQMMVTLGIKDAPLRLVRRRRDTTGAYM